MKNKSILLFFLILHFAVSSLQAQEISPEMDAFIARMDNATLEELETELNQGIEGLRAFAGFFERSGEEGIKNYTADEERFEKSFKIDTTAAYQAMHQFNNIGFQQVFRDEASLLKFQKIGDKYWNTVWMGEGMEEKFIPKTIFYKGGATVTEGIANNKLSFFFEEPWGKIAVIDSVQIDYNLRYTATYDSLEIAKKTKKVSYKDGVITVKRLEKNHLYLTISDQYKDRLTIRALNSEGKFLNQNSSSFSPRPDNKSKDGFGEVLSLLEDIQTKLKADKFKNTESLKKYLLKKADKFKSVKDKDGIYHLKYYFEGNIASLRLFIETEEKSKTVSFTAKNISSFRDVILMQNKTENIFLDSDAKELFRTPLTPIESLGSRYFQNDSLYYHINLQTKKLNKLDATYVWEATNGLAFIQQPKKDNLLMYNAEYELLSDLPFVKLYILDDEYVQGIGPGKENYILSATGAIKKLEGISEIGDPFDGRIAALKNGMMGFISTSGEVLIPFIYKEVENFKNGFAVVENDENKSGLIDIDGRTVIPLIYNKILSHENGFTWVSTDDAFQLLDKKGKILITEKGSSYFVNRSGADTTLQFRDKTYDAYGNLISDEKSDK